MVTLLLTEKGGETKQLNFEKDEVTVGRVQGNDIVLPKGNVSKRHCRIVSQGGKFSVEDLKSTNGTYINGRKIAEVTTVVGTDKIYVGDFVIRVESANEVAVPAPAEAGSLSTALPRRPPPPPTPGNRSTAQMPTQDQDAEPALAERDGRARSSGRVAVPPPPPPSRRDSIAAEAVNTMPPEPALPNIEPPLSEPDEEILPARPRLTVPPLKSPRPLLSTEDSGRALDEEMTSHRERASAAVPAVPPPPMRPSAIEGGTIDNVALWVRDLLGSDGASAIFVSGGRVEIERNGERVAVDPPAGVSLPDAVRALAARGTPRPSGDTRVVNVLLPENARLAAIFPPIAGELTAAIERVAPAGRTLAELASSGAISEEAQEVLEACVTGRRNILIGGDGRALEALLQAVAAAIPTRMRVVSLAEISPPPGSLGWTKLARDTHVGDVIRAASSLRPDYLIVDVNTPGLATDVLGQAALGQEGAIVAVAARSAADALARLGVLAGPALGGASHARELAATAFDVVVCAGTLADGNVRLLELGEPTTGPGGGEVDSAITWRPTGRGEGRFETQARVLGRLGATLAARGLELPIALRR